MRITIAGFKGGAAKTTTAIFLAECASREGPTLLIDADPQESAYSWLSSEAYEEDGGPTPARLSGRLSQELERLGGLYSHVIIDTPPGMSDAALTREAMAVSDLVVMPVGPSAVEANRVFPTFGVAQEVGRPAVVLLVKMRRTLMAQDVEHALVGEHLPVLEATVPLRASVEAAFGTRPKDLVGYDRVWEELKEIYEGMRNG